MVALDKEVLRWCYTAVLAGIPHANIIDVEYEGYCFLAGANMIGHLWAIHCNPRDFPDGSYKSTLCFSLNASFLVLSQQVLTLMSG